MTRPVPTPWPIAIEELESRARALEATPGLTPSEKLAAASALRAQLEGLEAEAMRRGEIASRHPFATLEARAEDLVRAASELGADLESERAPGAPDAALGVTLLRGLALRVLEGRTRMLEHEIARGSIDFDDPATARRLASALATSLARAAALVERTEPAPGSATTPLARELHARLIAAAQAHDEALLSAVRRAAERTPERASASASLNDATREVVDAAQDLYATIEDYSLAEAVSICTAAIERLETFERMLEQAPALPDAGYERHGDPLARRRPFRRVRQSLRRIARELASERAEKVLAMRLERRFGRRFLAVLENAVFVMIIAVLGIFAWEACGDPTAVQKAWLVGLDTAICAFFLAEFALRISFAPEKLRYLRRHALVDLLPSLPYGLLVEWLSGATALRVLRFLRLARLARYVRVARPLVRLLRGLLFALRGLDRIVRRNASLLNRALLFASDPPPPPACETAALRSERLGRALHRRELEALQDTAATERAAWLEQRTREIDAALRSFDPREARAAPVEPPTREMPVEHAIAALCTLDAARVIDALGLARTRELATAIGVLRMRPLRWLPGPRGFVKGIPREADPASVVAEVGRRAGLQLLRVHRALTWIRDLHGTLTGPQLLDKVGTTFVRATARPARRLLAFGGTFVILAGLATLLELELLGAATRFVARFLGLPILMLGGFALAFFLFGSWLRRVAGSATEYFSTVADAHFLRLTSLVKEHRAREDARFLEERAVKPEHELARLAGDALDASARARLDARSSTLDHMHRDYLRTPPLHPSDVRLSSFLLGNLALQGLLAGTLHLSRRERNALHALDLSKTGLFGPRLWFHFITSAIGQRAARLVVDYNRHCLSLEDLAHATSEQRDVFEAWLDARSAGLPLEERELAAPMPPVADEEPGAPLLEVDRARRALVARLRAGTWASAHFDALHFLSRDPHRDRAVRERFGPRVAACQLEDRRRLIREVFGTHPMTGLTSEQLAFNPYRFYWRWLDNGKILLAPLIALWFALRFFAAGCFRFFRLCREVLRPSLAPDAERHARCRFDIALRKIHRMRRPLYLTALELRARFDLEYHGLAWPGLEKPAVPSGTLEADLAFIGGALELGEKLRRRGEEHARALAELDAFLAERGHRLRDLVNVLRARGAPSWRERGEQVRAATLAYLADDGRIRTLVSALELEKRRDVKRATRAQRRLFRLLARTRAHGDPAEHVLCTLTRAAAQSDLWSERLFALRSVQSLAVLDLDVTQDLVWELGDFEADGEVRRVEEPAGLRGSRAAHVPGRPDRLRGNPVEG